MTRLLLCMLVLVAGGGCSAALDTAKGLDASKLAAGKTDGNIVIPSVSGLTETQARAALRAAGVRGEIRVVPNFLCGDENIDVPYGRICLQRPRAGSRQSPRLTVEIVAQRQRWLELPDVTGLPFEEARSRLLAAGFERVNRQAEGNVNCATGTVCDSFPRPGTKHVSEHGVQLYVGD